MQDPHNVAGGQFARGFNCSQSIFSAFAERLGITSELALRLASPFGAGIARTGHVCGALSGALMVLGLQYANGRPEGKDEIYRITREFVEQFEAQHRSVLCNELVGYDISTPDGLQAARENNIFATVCPALVDDTARALARYLDEHGHSQTI